MSMAAVPRMRTATPIRKPLPETSTNTQICSHCGKTCANCTGDIPSEAKRRIAELEAQVKLLTEKATSAVDKLADYEDQLHKFKAAQSNNTLTVAAAETSTSPSSDLSSSPPRTSRFSNLLSRRSLANLTAAPTLVPASNAVDLQAALARERDLREKAEGRVSQMNVEIEDLSVTLFQQANEMVAEERKARAKLEERVEVLEKRDEDKRKRLDRLEGAMKRIERVNALLKT